MVVQESDGYFLNGRWFSGRYNTYVETVSPDPITELIPVQTDIWDADLRPLNLTDTYALKDHTHECDYVVFDINVPTLLITVVVAMIAFILTIMFIGFI